MNSWLFHWDVSPIALATPFGSIYWYGIFFAWGVFLSCHLFERSLKNEIPQKVIERILSTTIISMLVGAKLGYLIFYTPLSHWPETLLSFRGLSFHGGLIGLTFGLRFAAAKYSIAFWGLADRLCCAAPWGLFFGRLGNLMNSELFGRPTLQNWGVVFERSDILKLPRHPSQLYEALGEGLFMGLILAALPESYRRREGLSCAIFLIGYGLLRCLIEEFRQPDPQIGLLSGWTMGQILSTAMIIVGLLLLVSSLMSPSSQKNLPIFDRSKEMICALRVKKI